MTNETRPVRVLVVDDDEAHAEAVSEALETDGCICRKATSTKAGIAELERESFDVILTDLVMRDGGGLEILRKARSLDPDAAVIVVTGHASIESAVAAMKEFAADYLTKPLKMDEVRLRVRRAARERSKNQENLELRRQNEELHRELDKRYGFEGIIGSSPAMQKLFELLQQIAPTDATVLILGESGTGKELVARAIHANSSRRAKPFVAINCAALSEGLIESELFGHEKGAFTGAIGPREGKLEFANRGTLFLDEVGDMPLSTQTKFLRAIEQREVVRLGSNRSIPVDLRIISATNQNLKERVAEGKFREDLYFRLAVVQMLLPPLRERTTDIPLLMDSFLAEFRKRHNKKLEKLTPEALAVLTHYHWPGNVRELRNVIETMVVTARGDVIDVSEIPPTILESVPSLPAAPRIAAVEAQVASDGGATQGLAALSNRRLEEIEREAIIENLRVHGGNRERVAQILGIGERTLYRKLKEYGIH
jgi:two-component system response regulator HydG